ncbi:Crp/Fnr family transcriptional regulator [Erythrobacter litoralis]|uniref:Crp/Fnr family transcriptional regulator n=1 Tax=Erythrobacter litoralis TaxID=39960 RepID=UPI0024349F4E|nr:Crp/Fnr family transcriptional regulator [Erythrobacter litoralis]
MNRETAITAAPDAESPLARRLSQYLDLTYSERDALRALEQERHEFEPGDIIAREDEALERMYIVGSGWLHASTHLQDGARQILRFIFVGEIATMFSVAWEYSAATLTAVSRCTLYGFERTTLGQLFREYPRLGALLYAVAAAEQVAMADRLTSIGRTDGMARIATLLLDIRSRLRAVGEISGSQFEVPLTQQDLGDAVGLTKTHIGRSLKALEKTGLVEREGRLIRITDVNALSDIVDFKDRHAHIDTSWIAQKH